VINEVIGEMVPLLRSEANEYAVSIRINLAAHLPTITADRVQLQQVLMNLMLNGIEAMKETGGILTVKSQLAENGQIQISVHNTGPGLPLGNADQAVTADVARRSTSPCQRPPPKQTLPRTPSDSAFSTSGSRSPPIAAQVRAAMAYLPQGLLTCGMR
jgi:hypothetical protein